jgi:hypothetical protein
VNFFVDYLYYTYFSQISLIIKHNGVGVVLTRVEDNFLLTALLKRSYLSKFGGITMAHVKGPVKGMMVVTCPDLAESFTIVIEPIELAAADYVTLRDTNAVVGDITASFSTDPATGTNYANLTLV